MRLFHFLAIVLMSLALSSFLVSAGVDKDITLTLYHGTRSALSIEALSPLNHAFFDSDDDINIDYFVYHPSSTQVSCALFLDNSLVIRIENSSSVESEQIIKNLQEGEHFYSLSCTDDLNASTASPEKSFIIDYTPPSVELNTPDDYLIFMDTLSLNFTAYDNLADQMSCDLFIDGSKKKSKSAIEGENTEFSITLDNGTYQWDVECEDEAGNKNTSNTRRVFVDTDRDFSVILNKDSFNMGEKGYYIITAPYNADALLTITDPMGKSIQRNYHGIFPKTDLINLTNIPGEYMIDAVLTYQGGFKQVEESFIVENTFSASAIPDKTEVGINEEVIFKARPSGDVGTLTYKWDFDDGGTSTEKSPKHKFSSVGNYDVKLEITDSFGNVATDTVTIYVKNTFTFEAIVKDTEDKPVQNALVFVDGEKKETNSEGKVSFSVLQGFIKVVVLKSKYSSIVEDVQIDQETSKTYYLGLLSSINISNTNLTDEDIADLIKKEVKTNNEEENNSGEEILDGGQVEVDGDIEALNKILTDSIYAVGNYDNEDRQVSEYLDMEEKLQDAKKTLLRYERDKFGLQYIDDQEKKKQRAQELEQELQEIKDNTIVHLTVIGGEEYPYIGEANAVQSALKKYFQITKAPADKIGDLVEANLALQSSIIVLRDIKNIEVRMLSGEEKTITLVKEDISIKDNQDILVLESVPKNLAKNSDEINFLSEYKIIESDPMMLYQLKNQEDIIYYLKNGASVDDTKDIVTIYVDPLAKTKKKGGISLTGLAIFSSISDIENPVLVIQIALIVLLLIVYIFYEFEILLKIRKYDIFTKLNPVNYIMGLLDKKMKELNALIKKAEKQINDEELKDAEDTYHNIIKIYNDSLSTDQRKKKIDKISSIYNELLIHRIKKSVKEIGGLVENKDKTAARKKYDSMQDLYRQLPKSWKTRVSSDCKKAFELLTK